MSPSLQSPRSIRSLRIACYGFAELGAGSVSSAGSVILDDLLTRGHQIDFFGKTSFFRPTQLEHHPNFHWVEVPPSRMEKLTTLLQWPKGGALAVIAGQIAHHGFAANITHLMRRNHREQPYDLQLLLGDWAWARIGDLPVVSWVQGPPETDARSISRRRNELIRLCGWKTYLPMRLFALYRRFLGLPAFNKSDVLIVGSEWARKRLTTYGVDRGKIKTLAYPIDLNRFTPAASLAHAEPPVILWVGRTVPRKRLDLFLDACEVLIQAGEAVQITVVGGFGRFSGYKKLIDEFQFRYPGRLKYLTHVERDAVIPLIQSAAVLVQPSEDENFGSSVAEALACGTPVVVGPTNGTGDYIESGGARFDSYDPRAVANAISQALHIPRHSPRQAAETNFDPRRITSELEKILFSAVSNKDSQPIINHLPQTV
jgi:glycosyltransferase involved in cell wall biosynthesis